MRPEDAYGKVLRDTRKLKGISQEKLALKGGLDRTFISLLERGLRQPSLTTILQIAEVLEESPDAMIKKVLDIINENTED